LPPAFSEQYKGLLLKKPSLSSQKRGFSAALEKWDFDVKMRFLGVFENYGKKNEKF
jgi:hypothetical protein